MRLHRKDYGKDTGKDTLGMGRVDQSRTNGISGRKKGSETNVTMIKCVDLSRSSRLDHGKYGSL